MKVFKNLLLLAVLSATGILSGCANYEVNTKRGNIPGSYIRYELQEADRAVEAARKAGKNVQCPEEFKAAEAARDNAYDVFRACRTEEGAALAKQATAKANALCPSTGKTAEKLAPGSPAATVAALSITPATITKGNSAKMSWSSQNAEECSIKPQPGKVDLQGTMDIKPLESMTYTLACLGKGGKAESGASITVITPEKSCPAKFTVVLFDTDKATIKPAFHANLKKVAALMKEYPAATVVVEGHTDILGGDGINVPLAERRAASTRDYLVKELGVAADRVSTKGYSSTKPVATNKKRDGRQANRRSEADFSCSSN